MVPPSSSQVGTRFSQVNLSTSVSRGAEDLIPFRSLVCSRLFVVFSFPPAQREFWLIVKIFETGRTSRPIGKNQVFFLWESCLWVGPHSDVIRIGRSGLIPHRFRSGSSYIHSPLLGGTVWHDPTIPLGLTKLFLCRIALSGHTEMYGRHESRKQFFGTGCKGTGSGTPPPYGIVC